MKNSFKGASTNDKLGGISMLNSKETIMKKINVSFIVHIIVNKILCLDTF